MFPPSKKKDSLSHYFSCALFLINLNGNECLQWASVSMSVCSRYVRQCESSNVAFPMMMMTVMIRNIRRHSSSTSTMWLTCHGFWYCAKFKLYRELWSNRFNFDSVNEFSLNPRHNVSWEEERKITYVLDIYYANYVIEFMIFRRQLWANLWVCDSRGW